MTKRVHVSFLKRIFGSKKPSNMEYVSAMEEMAEESERTHRGMVQIYNEDVAVGILSAPNRNQTTLVPTGRGIYKARLFGALFIAHAYTVSRHSQDEVTQMISIATALALKPLVDAPEPTFTRDDARALIQPYLWPTLKAITAAFKAGPIVAPTQYRNEHLALADKLHDALAESIGRSHYTEEVKERFDTMIMGNVHAAMSHSANWFFQ